MKSKFIPVKSVKLLLLILFVPLLANAQEKLTLAECHSMAEENYPLIKQKQLIDKYEQAKLSNLKKNYLPKLDLNARAVYQSDVTELALEMPPNMPFQLDFPQVDKDSYKATLDVSQLIYDGGSTKKMKELEHTSAELKHKKLETELYAIKATINHLFFSIILSEKQKNILELTQKSLQQTLNKLEVGIKHGAVLQSEANIVKAEIIKLQQNLAEIKASNSSNKKMLSEYLNIAIGEETIFEMPTIASKMSDEIIRPELQVFDLNKKNLEASKAMIKTKTMPVVSAFGQARIKYAF